LIAEPAIDVDDARLRQTIRNQSGTLTSYRQEIAPADLTRSRRAPARPLCDDFRCPSSKPAPRSGFGPETRIYGPPGRRSWPHRCTECGSRDHAGIDCPVC
jgi:hypothetical protein